MRNQVYTSAEDTSGFHNATLVSFIFFIIVIAVALVLLFFAKFTIHPAVLVYLFSMDALLTSTVVKHLRTSVRINQKYQLEFPPRHAKGPEGCCVPQDQGT